MKALKISEIDSLVQEILKFHLLDDWKYGRITRKDLRLLLKTTAITASSRTLEKNI